MYYQTTTNAIRFHNPDGSWTTVIDPRPDLGVIDLMEIVDALNTASSTEERDRIINNIPAPCHASLHGTK